MVLPSKVRQAIYVVTAVASPVMAYLLTQGTITEFSFGLFSVVVTAVTTLAAVNVSTK
jgi:uncharacterized membrane protein YvlD (DUF360 family)